ncbi:MAG: hypothetical protein M1828_002506 [Chrysothrix sp. TS-e1954]|nr:MAG: hypothetical protein M1828_002506 [Chrysothrix sp. TS-e1954]
MEAVQAIEQDDLANDHGQVKVQSSAADEEGNKFDKAIAAWRNINLTELVPSLDTTASNLVAHQRDALLERKDLAQKTKEFRRLEDAEKLNEVKTLLKSYQSYIDLVSNQSKSVSSAFLKVYSTLSEAPDPFPLLEASVDSLVLADTTVPSLEAENTYLQDSVARLTSQLEGTEKQLENEQATRKVASKHDQSRALEQEASWSAVLKEKQNNWDAKERTLEQRVENQDRLLKELKANFEVSQRLDSSTEESASKHADTIVAELDIVNADLERVSARVTEMEVRNEQLTVELAQSTSLKGGPGKETTIEDDPAYLRLRSENSTLIRTIDALRLERDAGKREREADMRGLHREKTRLHEDNDILRGKMHKWRDYEDIKQELEVVKSIELSTDLNDEADDDQARIGSLQSADGNALSEQSVMPSSQKLEHLLVAKNKKLNNELTLLRVSHQDLASRFEDLQDELSNSNMDLEKSRITTAGLENDIARIEQQLSSSHKPQSVSGTNNARLGAFAKRGRTSPTSSIISGIEVPQTPSSSTDPVSGTSSGILPMVTAQRDRFRKRNSELETDLKTTHQTVSSLRSEIMSLQKDNLNLYEKTRYVSSYARATTASTSSFYRSANPNPANVQLGDDPVPLDRYRSQYESRISPFAAFRGRESTRAFKRMTIPERGILQITRLVLATRTSRNIFALYCLGLHLLVLGILYYATTLQVEEHAANLANQAQDAMIHSGSDSAWTVDAFENVG